MSKMMKTRSSDPIHSSEKGSSKIMTIDSLDDVCLEKILSYLTPEELFYAEKISKKMKIASRFAWRKVKEWDPSHKAASGDVKDIFLRCGRFLKKISMGLWSSGYMQLITLLCNNLTTIELYFSEYREKDFKNAFTNMTQLKSINIQGFQMRPAKNRINVLESLPESIEEIVLESFGLHTPLRPTQPFQQCYLEKWKNLKKLTLENWKLDEDMMEVLTQNGNLTHLGLSNCRIYGLKAYFSNFVNLEYLDLSLTDDTPRTADELFMAILDAMSCKKLKHLNISNCCYMLRAFYRFIEELPELEELILNSMEDDRCSIDDSILTHFRGLKVFECADSLKVTDAGIMEIFRNCPDLETLNIFSTGVTGAIVKHALDFSRNRPEGKKLVVRIHKGIADEADVAEANASSFCLIEERPLLADLLTKQFL